MLSISTKRTHPLCVTSSERIKLLGTLDGYFPDFGHHLEREMGGLWMHPIKLLDGFWMQLKDRDNPEVAPWMLADAVDIHPWGQTFHYRSGLGHTPLAATRSQLAPDEQQGLLVRYTFQNRSDRARRMTATFLGRTDLRPVWFSEQGGIVDGFCDEGTLLEGVFHAKDSAHEWHVAIQPDCVPDRAVVGQHFGPQNTNGNGISVALSFDLVLQAQESASLTFAIAGSTLSEADCLAALHMPTFEEALRQKTARYEALLARGAVQLPDPALQTVYDWTRVHTDWLTVSVPEVGRGLAAGLPEYPWWFSCDSCYALQGILAIGDFALAKDTLRLLMTQSNQHNGNGRIVHEITTGGQCVNPGNTQEAAHFVAMVWLYYQWTGDRAFLSEALPTLQQSIEWLDSMDDDGDDFPSGYGIIEIKGLNAELIDTATYTAWAHACYASMLTVLGDPRAEAASVCADRITNAVNTRLWDEEHGMYCDVHAAPSKVKALRERMGGNNLFPLPTDDPDRERGLLLNGNWVIATPMECGIAPKDQAERALSALHTDRFVGRFGAYLDALTQRNTMTISTGVYAVAQARYGHPDRALELLQKLSSTFGMGSPACVSEMSPDDGCFVQAWTAYAIFVPIVQYFFGLQPNAADGVIDFNPCMPTSWAQATLQDVLVLDGMVDISFSRNDAGAFYVLENHTTYPVRVPHGLTATQDGHITTIMIPREE